MSESASEDQIAAWKELAEHADECRVEDVTAMDIYNITLPKGRPSLPAVACSDMHVSIAIPRREVQARLMEAELDADSGIGITAWLATGLKIQETQ